MTEHGPATNQPDPFLLELIRSSFDAIADQMALIMLRTAHSGIVRDTMDYSTALCDAKGRTLAQGVTNPVHLGSFYDAMQCVLRRFDGDFNGGDVFIFNDPYEAAGQHLPDIYIVKPIFFAGQLVAFATTVAHHSDVGGMVPGSNAIGSTEIFQEGLRLPILKFLERGVPVQPIWDIIRLNVRVPDDVMGDLQAQMAACTICEREVEELYRRYGGDTLGAYVEHLHDYAEQLARSQIAAIPDGVYEFSDHLDGLGENPEPIALHVKITVRGSNVVVDWTGTSPQVPGGVNAPLPFTKAAAYAALRSVMSAAVPNCHGYTRPITVVAPLGSLVNVKYPGPCGIKGITGYRMIDCLFGALAKAVPDKVAADNSGGATLPTIAGYENGKAFVFCETVAGNWGAAFDHDGQDGVAHMGANQTNIPIEMIEARFPVRIEQYGIITDTGGPGTFRGGLSVIREYRLVRGEALLMVRSDKRAFPPHGLFGGHEGAPSFNIVNPETDPVVLPVMTTEPYSIKQGDVFRHIMAGGGGFGEPLSRDPARVVQDVIEERITIAGAERDYGVVIVGNPPLVDQELTRRLRQRRGISCNAVSIDAS
ncbi:MAG: hydantoinase B/oxoprolinase family protein [Alphaproteobacteria bacterium]|nr:hydantoinase B/oxoprolinase family protein [Alphaproteobacteria bacterium]